MQRDSLKAARRLVLKLGSAVLARDGELDVTTVSRLAAEIAACGSGRQIVIVSSGAVASGFRGLGLNVPPKTIVGKQAAAAVGQPRLMNAWSGAFGSGASGRAVAQVLLTADDLDHRGRFLNARATLGELLARGIVPIINENDSVSFAEIKLGDNDHLSALVAGLVSADLLIMLSSVPGVLEGGKPGTRIPLLSDPGSAMAHVTKVKTETGTGGMATKLRAAATAASMGIPSVIADGREPGVLARVLAGEDVGTLCVPVHARKLGRSRQRWLGLSARVRGTIVVDEGARIAIIGRHASLLPGGVVGVEGEFAMGAPVELRTKGGAVFARGLARYCSEELRLIRGERSSRIRAILGYAYCDEVVHRSDIVTIG
jgi:glutamate 5-kinase